MQLPGRETVWQMKLNAGPPIGGSLNRRRPVRRLFKDVPQPRRELLIRIAYVRLRTRALGWLGGCYFGALGLESLCSRSDRDGLVCSAYIQLHVDGGQRIGMDSDFIHNRRLESWR